MKKFLFSGIIAFAMISCNSDADNKNLNQDSLALVQKQSALKDSANFTTAEWVDSTSKDQGKVKKGQVIEIPFTIKNTGDKPLIISEVIPGCGCTVADKPEKPIMPGSEEKIVAKFNSEGQSNGVHVKNITVKANTKPFTDHVLNFKVDVTD